jgi:hypothetical protein
LRVSANTRFAEILNVRMQRRKNLEEKEKNILKG